MTELKLRIDSDGVTSNRGLKYSMGLKNLVNNLLYYIYLLC